MDTAPELPYGMEIACPCCRAEVGEPCRHPGLGICPARLQAMSNAARRSSREAAGREGNS